MTNGGASGFWPAGVIAPRQVEFNNYAIVQGVDMLIDTYPARRARNALRNPELHEKVKNRNAIAETEKGGVITIEMRELLRPAEQDARRPDSHRGGDPTRSPRHVHEHR